jgi:hypothetical protein
MNYDRTGVGLIFNQSKFIQNKNEKITPNIVTICSPHHQRHCSGDTAC